MVGTAAKVGDAAASLEILMGKRNAITQPIPRLKLQSVAAVAGEAGPATHGTTSVPTPLVAEASTLTDGWRRPEPWARTPARIRTGQGLGRAQAAMLAHLLEVDPVLGG